LIAIVALLVAGPASVIAGGASPATQRRAQYERCRAADDWLYESPGAAQAQTLRAHVDDEPDVGIRAALASYYLSQAELPESYRGHVEWMIRHCPGHRFHRARQIFHRLPDELAALWLEIAARHPDDWRILGSQRVHAFSPQVPAVGALTGSAVGAGRGRASGSTRRPTSGACPCGRHLATRRDLG
jgi:hypothetical protein